MYYRNIGFTYFYHFTDTLILFVILCYSSYSKLLKGNKKRALFILLSISKGGLTLIS